MSAPSEPDQFIPHRIAAVRRIEIATPTNASAELTIRLCFLASRKCGPRCSFVRSDLSLERPTTACPRLHSVVAVLRRVGRQHEYHGVVAAAARSHRARLTKLVKPGIAFWPMAHQYRHVIPSNPERLICNHRMFDV